MGVTSALLQARRERTSQIRQTANATYPTGRHSCPNSHRVQPSQGDSEETDTPKRLRNYRDRAGATHTTWRMSQTSAVTRTVSTQSQKLRWKI